MYLQEKNAGAANHGDFWGIKAAVDLPRQRLAMRRQIPLQSIPGAGWYECLQLFIKTLIFTPDLSLILH